MEDRYRMKRFFLLLLLITARGLLNVEPLVSQSNAITEAYGNEWIDTNQRYYKLTIDHEGIYRINYDVLIGAGIPLERIQGSQFEIISMGQPIAIRSSTLGLLGPQDYIEFYGIPQDGVLDSALYDTADKQHLNPLISMYSKSRAYFLSWSTESKSQQYRLQDNGLNNGGLPLQEAYYMHEERIVFDEFHNKPSRDGRNFIRYSSMDIGEGFGSRISDHQSIELPISALSSFGVNPTITFRFASNESSRQWEAMLNDIRLQTVFSGGLNTVGIEEQFELEVLQGRSTAHLTIKSINNPLGRQSLAYVILKYPRQYIFDNVSFVSYLQQPSIISRFIEIQGFEGDRPLLYNIDKKYYIRPELKDEVVRYTITQALQEEQWVLVDEEEGIRTIDSLQPVNLASPNNWGNYMIITHSELMESGSIEAYATYRSSDEGGAYDVDIVDIEDLYNIHAYGVHGHPLAIKNMMRYLRHEEQLPSYVFLIGKGYEYAERRADDRAHVPTFGVPGSDNLLVARKGEHHPEIPIGRLAAVSPQQVTDYLAKVTLQENPPPTQQTQEDQGWKKKVLHLSGGSANDQEILLEYLNDMRDVIATNSFGGEVYTFRKTSADPIEAVHSEDIVAKINAGAAILTFFGHSAVGTFDFSLEDPSQYDNKGRNPIILSLGCHSGNIHTNSQGISEEFVLEPDNGAIAFIASSGTAYPEPQHITGVNLYDLIGSELYGRPIGNVIQRALKKRSASQLLEDQTLLEQLTLHGDPAFRYASFLGPDYIVDHQSVVVQPDIIDATSPKIRLSFEVVNIGAVIAAPVEVSVLHLLPDGSTRDTSLTITTPTTRNTLTIDIDNPGSKAVGTNRFLIRIDPNNSIEELPETLAEANNDLIDDFGVEGVNFVIYQQNAKPTFPPNYGIINDPNLTLTATVTNGLASGGRFAIQLDTTAQFDSPLLQEQNIVSPSSIVSWQPSVIWENDRVYYWRIAPIHDMDTLPVQGWQTSSFLFLQDYDKGWNQSHYYQKKVNDYNTLSLDQATRTLQFAERIWDVRIKNELRSDFDFWVFVNNTPWQSLNPKSLAPAIAIFIFDQNTILFPNKGTDFGSLPYSRDLFLYKMDKAEDRKNIKELLDAVPDGARVFMHTILADEFSDLHIEEWESDTTRYGFSLFDVLESHGATKVRDLKYRGTVPYTFVFDKNRQVVVEDIANTIYESLDLSSKAKTIWHQGSVSSLPIGPAYQWSNILWQESVLRYDDTKLAIYGIPTDGERQLLKVVSANYNIDISDINATTYPHLQLEYISEDLNDRTSADLNHWRVIYDALPDLAILNDGMPIIAHDTLDEGSPLHLAFQLGNLSPTAIEPVIIKYTLIGEDRKPIISLKRTDQYLMGHEISDISQIISTAGLSGAYQLIIEANPGGAIAELTDCNNFGYYQLYIIPDDNPPLLSVTFDGRSILDGERISPQPSIVVSLEDVPSKLLLNDPADFDITLFYPVFLRWKVDNNSPNAEFIPATDLNNNIAQFVMTPNLNVNGTYTLEVRAKDRAGNPAQAEPYRITFTIDDTADLPDFNVHPNPVSDYVQFDYVLRGEFIPEVFGLYIYSPDGKLVKYASAEDWGGIRPGLNTYTWHIKQSDQRELPSGIYYYQLRNNLDRQEERKKGSLMLVR